jgi:hypothetical protein
MWIVALLGVFFALINYLGSHATAVIVLFGLVVFAHVAGNAIGTRLRASGSRLANRAQTTNLQRSEAPTFAPATRLRQRKSLGRTIIVVTTAGIVVGALVGGLGFSLLANQPVTIASVAMGATASAVLGGIWTFMAASFVQVAIGAAWQASRERR